MTVTTLLLLFALIAGVAASWERLVAEKPLTRWTARVSIVCLLGTLGLEAIRSYREWRETETMREFFNLQEPTADEASGGTFAEGKAFIVDDETRGVFVFEPSGVGKPLEFRTLLSFKVGEEHHTLTSEIDDEPVKVEKADDLEGAAAFDDKLYVVTSHSKNKKSEEKPERRLFLELEINGNHAIVSRSADLKPQIRSFLGEQAAAMGASLSCAIDHLEIEGLAIDPESQKVYFGFRKPTFNLGRERYAIVLGLPIEEVFESSPSFELFALGLRSGTASYGIVALEYDLITHSILVLGGSTEREDFSYTQMLWKWVPGKATFQTPTEISSEFVRLPDSARAKLEALVIVSEDQFVFFVDSEGHGGQRIFDRASLGLSRAGGA